MVKTITLRLDDSIFIKLQNAKKVKGVKKKLSLSWEEFVIMTARV